MYNHRILTQLALMVSPERLIIYKSAVDILLQKDLEMYDMLMDNFESTMAENYTVYNVADFDEFLLEHLVEAVEEFGVYLSDRFIDARAIEPLAPLLTMLYGFEHYEDPNELLTIIDSDIPDSELIGELVTSLTEYTRVESYMDLIEEVSSSLIQRMKETLNDAIKTNDVVGVSQAHDAVIYARVMLASKLFNNRVALDLLANGAVLGRPYPFYANAMTLRQTDPNDISKTLLVAGIMAKLGKEETIKAAGEFLANHLHEKADVLIRIGRLLSKNQLVLDEIYK